MHLFILKLERFCKVLIKFNILPLLNFLFYLVTFLRGDDIGEDSLPVITIYTHEHCSLCDDLVEELEVNFHGRYQLMKVDITKRENLKYLQLYRLDIPVCFLNGQFLCMHRLNSDLLSKRLEVIKNSK